MSITKAPLNTIDQHYPMPVLAGLLKSELAALAMVLPKIFGYYIVQIGGPIGGEGVLATSKIHNRIIVNPMPTSMDNLMAIQCNQDELPFLPESLDACVLFHTLEFAPHPKTILQETYDSLINGGHLVILGFNPYSLWGITKFFKRTKKDIWGGNWISPRKLNAWLSAIGFSTYDYQTFYFCPPIENPKKMLFLEEMGSILWPYGGASYILIAHKVAAAITPIDKSKSWAKQRLVTEELANTTSPQVTKCQNRQSL